MLICTTTTTIKRQFLASGRTRNPGFKYRESANTGVAVLTVEPALVAGLVTGVRAGGV